MDRDQTGNVPNTEQISEKDVVFDCTVCGKNLVIAQEGIGLVITCPDCESRLEVPSQNYATAGVVEEGHRVASSAVETEDLTQEVRSDGTTPGTRSAPDDGSDKSVEERLIEAQERNRSYEEEIDHLEREVQRLHQRYSREEEIFGHLEDNVEKLREQVYMVQSAVDRMVSVLDEITPPKRDDRNDQGAGS